MLLQASILFMYIGYNTYFVIHWSV